MLLAVGLPVAGLASACSRESAPTPAPTPTPTPAPAKVLGDEQRKGLVELLGAYEAIHAALAADHVEGVAAAAGRITTEAAQLAPAVPAALRPHLTGLADTARALAGATTLADARLKFGEVSRHAVALVEAVPELQQGRRVFECTMVASGYGRWVQTGPGVANPYYGSQMLTCGSPVD